MAEDLNGYFSLVFTREDISVCLCSSMFPTLGSITTGRRRLVVHDIDDRTVICNQRLLHNNSALLIDQ